HLGVQLDISGLEHIGGGPYVIVALHEGIADVLCLLQLPLPMRFVARREIFTWPGIGPAITRLEHVSINPEHPLGGFRDLWRGAQSILAGGESVALFPQGAIAGIQSDFHRGAFEVARRVNAPILPVAITGTHRVWEHPFAPTLRYGQDVSVRVLPPISATEIQSASQDHLRVRTRRAMKAAALASGMAPARHFDPGRDGYWDGYRLDIDPDFPDLARHMADHRASLHRGTA
ncbi:lysophospholipid acyltransferase family protein, partial [Deinococcus sp.]|uniref:lysophospholipid acyltransferase family protein n=1 Tax=Deinococcus sp. TaxID=47478 RepID=UPI002869AC07